ncbi:MAG: glycosyltransferase [Spirochaetia bacterium]|nr:glycosyltransferase [Spirochaetia bacterium]
MMSQNVKFFVVTNGFEKDRLDKFSVEKFGEISIVYTGSFYFPIRTIEPFFKALSLVKDYDKLEWKFHYYGKHSHHIIEMGEKFNITSRIVDHGMVTKDKALEVTKSADLFVVISSVSPDTNNENKIMVTGKIFDALGAGTPILLIAPPGSDPEKIMDNKGVRFSGDQVEEMAEYLRSVIENGIERNTPAYEYEWTRLAVRYNDIVQKLVSEYTRENNQ